MLPGRVRPWAVVSGYAGIAANVVLVLFYVLSTPWQPGSPLRWLGPVNDALVQGQFMTLAVVLEAVRRKVSTDPRGHWWARLGILASVGVAVLQILLLTGVLPFRTQVVLLAPCALVAVWAVGAVSQSAASLEVLPIALARFARVLAVGLVAGVAVLALASAAGAALDLGWVAWVVGALPAVAVWFAFPLWALWLARVPALQRTSSS